MSSASFYLSQLHVRPVEPSDCGLLWRWANDKAVRKYSFSPEEIPFVRHREWFQRKIASPDTRIYVIELKGEPIGQVRYDRVNENEAQIDISIASEHRGRNLGSFALALTRKIACRDLKVDRVIGVVVEGNLASCVTFRKAGFTEQAPKMVRGRACRVFYWPNERAGSSANKSEGGEDVEGP